MNSNISFNKMGNHQAVKFKLKSILSIITMGIFIFFGFASIDEGDPETKTVDCELLKPAVTVAQRINFRVRDENGNTPVGFVVNFVISEYDKVNNSGQCNLMLAKSYNKNITLLSNADVSFTLNKKYLSNDDELEIYFETLQAGYYVISRTLKLNKSDQGIDFSINVRKITQYP